jgi:hypothetical protein
MQGGCSMDKIKLLSNLLEVNRTLYLKERAIEELIEKGQHSFISVDYAAQEGIYLEGMIDEILGIDTNTSFGLRIHEILFEAFYKWLNGHMKKDDLLNYYREFLDTGNVSEKSENEIDTIGEDVKTVKLSALTAPYRARLFNAETGAFIVEIVCKSADDVIRLYRDGEWGVRWLDGYYRYASHYFDDENDGVLNLYVTITDNPYYVNEEVVN